MAINPIAQKLVNYLRQKQAMQDGTDDGTDDSNDDQQQPVTSNTANTIGTSLTTRDQANAMVNNPQVNGFSNAMNNNPQAIAAYNNIPHFDSSNPLASPTDNGQGDNSDNSDNFDVGKLLQQRLNQYSQLAGQPAQKQSIWKQAAFLGLQALQHAVDPQNSTPFQLLGNAKKAKQLNDLRDSIAPLLQQQQIQQQMQAARDRSAYQKAQTSVLVQKPDIDRAKIDAQRQRDQATAEYHNNLVTLGKEKADNIKAYRDDIIDLKQQGVDQNDTRIQQAQQRIDELIRNNKAKNAQAATNEQGKNNRFNTGQQNKAALATAKMQFELAMKQYQTATGADKTAAQINYNNARTAYLDALTKSKTGQ